MMTSDGNESYDIGPYRTITKKDAAHIQILTACSLLYDGQWECAITLAGAAEGQIPETERPTLFSMYKRSQLAKGQKSEREIVAGVNDLRDWLKHNSDQESKLVAERLAIFMVARAMTKYWNAYGDNFDELKTFSKWSNERGFTSAILA